MKTRFRAVLGVLLLAASGGAIHSLLPGSSSRPETSEPSAASTSTAAAKASRFDRARGPGLRHTYATRFDQDVALTSGSGPTANASVHIRVSGDLDLAFVGYADGKHRLFAQLAAAHVEMGSSPRSPKAAAVEHELSRPFYVVTERDGRVRRYAFARDLSPVAQNILRGVVGTAQLAMREGDAWTADEDDIQGSYVASYSKADDGALLKTKRPYTKLEGMSTMENRASGRAFVGDDGWPTKLSFDEHKVASMGEGMPVATTDARLEMTLSGTRSDASLLGRWEQEADAFVDAGPFGAGDDAAAARVADARLVGAATTDSILAGAASATDDAAMIAIGDKLAARLRLTPADADRVATLATTLPAREGNLVVGALGGAGTPESTKALGRLVGDRQGSPALRANAATQLAFATGANAAEARDSLSQNLSDPSREVRESSALALGNVARELGDADGDSVQELLRRYEGAKDDEERVMLLEALGNSGSREILPAVRAALANESEALREAAAHALRFLPLGEADTVLAHVLGRDPSQTVVLAAIDSIGFRVVEMHAHALERQLLADRAGRVRGAVAEVVRRALSTRKATLSANARALLDALLAKAAAATN